MSKFLPEFAFLDPERGKLAEKYARECARKHIDPSQFFANLATMGFESTVSDWSDDMEDWAPAVMGNEQNVRAFVVPYSKRGSYRLLGATAAALGLHYAQLPFDEGKFRIAYIHFDNRAESMKDIPEPARKFGIVDVSLIVMNSQQKTDLERVLQPITTRMFEAHTRRLGFPLPGFSFIRGLRQG